MNGHEIDQSAWGATVPATGPIGVVETLGFWFEIDAPGMLAGFRQYSDGHHPNFAFFQLWDSSGVLVAQMARTAFQTAMTPANAPGWRNTWLKPRAALAASTPYLVSASVLELWASFGALVSGPHVDGHFTVYQNGTSPNPANGVYDADTDANFRFSFVNPPEDATVGHFYGIDVLVRF